MDIPNTNDVSDRRIFAGVIDLFLQIALLAGPVVLGRYLPVHVDLPGFTVILWAVFPLLYSASTVITSASPAQWMLGLRIVSVSGGRPSLGIRILRACIIKAIYILFLASFVFEFWVPRKLESAIAFGFLSAVIGLLITFFIAEERIDLGRPPFYDTWLHTTVIRLGETGRLSRRGFDVISKQGRKK